MREQALEDAKDKFKDETDAKVDAIEKQSKAEQDAYQKSIERLRRYKEDLNDAIEDELKWRTEAYDLIENHADELYTKLLDYNNKWGDGLQETVDQWFRQIEGWEKYGKTFPEAMNNIIKELNRLEEETGIGIENTTTKVLGAIGDMLNKWREKLVAEGKDDEAQIIDDFVTAVEDAAKRGLTLSDEAYEKIKQTIDKADIKTLDAIANVIGGLANLSDQGKITAEDFSKTFDDVVWYLEQGKISAGELAILWNQYMKYMNDSTLVYGQNIVNNLAIIKEWMEKTDMTYDEAQYRLRHEQRIDELDNRGFAAGGVVDYTGPAQVHGSASKPEVVFNAQAASKLYEYVVSTPNLVKSMLNDVMSGVPPIKNTSIGGSTNINADTNIVINGNANDDTVAQLRKVADNIKNDVVKSLNESLSRRGITRSPRLV